MRVLQAFVFVLAVIGVLVLGVLLGIDNSDAVALAFLEWRSPELPVFIWMCVALIVGVALGALLMTVSVLRQRRLRRQAERQRDARHRELDALRRADAGEAEQARA